MHLENYWKEIENKHIRDQIYRNDKQNVLYIHQQEKGVKT